MSNTVIPILTKAELIFKDLVWDRAVEAAVSALFSWVPFLVPFMTALIKKFTDKLFEFLRLWLDLSIIGPREEKKRAEYARSQLELQLIIDQKGQDSDAYRLARDRAKERLALHSRYAA